MIELYSTHCPKCNVIEKKLKEKGIEFKIIDAVDEVVKFGAEHNKNTAPLLAIDGKVLDFIEANKWLNSNVNNEPCGACKLG